MDSASICEFPYGLTEPVRRTINMLSARRERRTRPGLLCFVFVVFVGFAALPEVPENWRTNWPIAVAMSSNLVGNDVIRPQGDEVDYDEEVQRGMEFLRRHRFEEA